MDNIGITAYEHVGIRVSDRAAAVAFYEQLGFVLSQDFPEHSALEMENEGGVRINLIYNAVRRDKNILMDEAVRYPGVTHPAFVVRSLAETIAALGAQGIALSEGPLEVDERRRICFVRDPDGNVVEFDELLTP